MPQSLGTSKNLNFVIAVRNWPQGKRKRRFNLTNFVLSICRGFLENTIIIVVEFADLMWMIGSIIILLYYKVYLFWQYVLSCLWNKDIQIVSTRYEPCCSLNWDGNKSKWFVFKLLSKESSMLCDDCFLWRVFRLNFCSWRLSQEVGLWHDWVIAQHHTWTCKNIWRKVGGSDLVSVHGRCQDLRMHIRLLFNWVTSFPE